MCFVHLWPPKTAKTNERYFKMESFVTSPRLQMCHTKDLWDNCIDRKSVKKRSQLAKPCSTWPCDRRICHMCIHIIYIYFSMRNRMHMIGVATGQWIMLSEQVHELNLEFCQDDTKCVYDCRIVEVYTGKCSRYLTLLLFGASRCSQRKG